MSKKNQLTTTDYLPWGEYKRLTSCLHNDNDVLGELYAKLAVITALRISDVLSLTWALILNKDHFVITETKTRKTKRIDVSPKSQETIRELYKLAGTPDISDNIFMNKRTGEPYSKRYINMLMKEWKAKYNLSVGNFSSHSFRKTFGRYIYNNSENKTDAITHLQFIFNHTSPQITLRYIGIRQEEITSVYGMVEV